jgi:hypothetical protein
MPSSRAVALSSAKLACGRAVEQPGHQHAILDQIHLRDGDALAVERL